MSVETISSAQPAQTRAELAQHLAEQLGVPVTEALPLVHGFFDVLTQQLHQGREVSLTGFGRFQLNNKGERPARNPRTGDPVMIAPRRVVTFRAGPQLKARVQQAMAQSDETTHANGA